MIGTAKGHWVERLRPDPSTPVHRFVPEYELQRAVSEIGQSAVDWAMVTGCATADIVGRRVPQFGGNGFPVVLPTTMQTCMLAALVGIRHGTAQLSATDDVDREILRMCAVSGIELTAVFTAMRRGHGFMVERLMQECRSLTELEEQSTQFQLISELCFDLVERLATRSAHAYAEERQRWLANPMAARMALVDGILSGDDDDAVDASPATLRYEIRYRHHVAVCAWSMATPALGIADVEDAAVDVVRRWGATQTLIVQGSDGTVTVWANSRGPVTAQTSDVRRLPDGVGMAVGTVGADVDGFRTTARESREAATIARRLVGLAEGRPVRFSDVSHIGLLTSDIEAAERFVSRELGDLARADDGNDTLRETVEAYLECHSPMAVAQRLFIARNTVTYRLRKATELLGRPIDQRQQELRAALFLARTLRGYALD